jgi:DNA mismatch repair protein MutS
MRFKIDKQTLEDLNIFGKNSGGSIFSIFDKTATRGGSSILEEMFRMPLSDEHVINKRIEMISFFMADPSFPFDSELFDIVEQYLENTDQRTKLPYDGNTIAKKLSNFIAEDTNYKFVYAGVKALMEILINLRDFVNAIGDKGATPYQTEIGAIYGLLVEGALADLFVEKKRNKLSYEQVAAIDVLLRFRNRELIRKLLNHIYHLDVYNTVGKVAMERNFKFPKALPATAHSVVLEAVYHPQLKHAVANTFRLTPGNNITFLTGANMAGKSTFMKSIGIAMFLAHMGFPVPAKYMEFSVKDGIYTTINLPDNLGTGTSHFYAEVLRVKKIAQELSLGKNLFIIIDELFRGTNVKDAYEATVAITEAFAKKSNSMFVISTHIIEAGDVLKQRCKNIDFKYLPTLMDGNSPVYTYQLKDGITADRHGMIIINNEDILDILKKGKEKKV